MQPQLIRFRVRTPAIGENVVARPRLRKALADAADQRSLLVVVAPAGSGKTTAVVQFLGSQPGPSAWFTVGEGDASAARFLLYLVAAVASADEAAAARAQALLQGGAPPADCAAVLAEDLAEGTTVVLDDLHHVASHPPVLAVLRAFLQPLPRGTLTVLISRHPIAVDLGQHILRNEVGALAEEDLLFQTEEIEALLDARGLPGVPEEIHASSGGWAAGIVFSALRIGAGGSPGAPTDDDPFFSYLGAEVLGTLPLELRRIVLCSALLDVVSAGSLGRLLQVPSGDAVIERITRNHLPVTAEPEGLRYHPRFREFLLATLRREYPRLVRPLTARHARLLCAEGHMEEAADGLLRAGELDEAADLVAATAGPLLSRGDWAKVLAWCEALGDERISRRSALREAQLHALSHGRRHEEITGLVRRMKATGDYDHLVSEFPDAACVAVEALHVSGFWGSLLDLIPPDEASPFARAMRYTLVAGSADHPPRDWDDIGAEPFAVGATIAQAGFYIRGRLAVVERFAAAARRHGPVSQKVADLCWVAALRQRGDLTEARRVFDASSVMLPSVAPELWRWTEAELVFAEGDREEGLGLIRDARRTAAALGHEVADNAIFAVAEGKMLLRLGAVLEAAEILRGTRSWCIARGLPAFREWADTWLAAALLKGGVRGDEPTELLAEAIHGMRRAERRLELPAANVFMAEARWRQGDDRGHDASAAAAHAASVEIGSFGPLLIALEEMPDVLTRMIDAESDDDETWRSLARSYVSFRTRMPTTSAPVVIRTFGRLALESRGVEIPITPSKAIELAAAVARAGDRGAWPEALVRELFDESADGANYLRQLIYRLRRALPPAVELVLEDGRYGWRPLGAVVSEEQMLESTVARARRETGGARLETLAHALEIADRGVYLPGVDRAAVHDARAFLDATIADVRREYARLLIAAGRPARAVGAARTAVTLEPYREDGWQVLMRAEAAAKGPAAAVPAFLECTRALSEIGLEPSEATRDLLGRLRGRPSPWTPTGPPASSA